MKIVLVPAKADVNVISTVIVTVFPDPVLLYELPLTLHWLFWIVEAEPGSTKFQLDVSSLANQSRPPPRSIYNQQACVALRVELKSTWAPCTSEYPSTLEAAKVKVWLKPLPDEGVTEVVGACGLRTIRVTLAVWLSPPPVPVKVRVYVPGGAELEGST